jgi:hypothetical protein
MPRPALNQNLRFPIRAAVAAAAFTAVLGTADAATPYDGTWTVVITTTRGSCSSGGSFRVEIRNGKVYGGGAGVSVGGGVSGNGAVRVSVRSGNQYANGSGRLRGSSGGGSWRGVGTEGTCTGVWQAGRG